MTITFIAALKTKINKYESIKNGRADKQVGKSSIAHIFVREIAIIIRNYFSYL